MTKDDVGAYAFDLYGTLVDFSSLASHFTTAQPSADAFVAAWRTKQLGLTWTATLMSRYVDFDTLTDASYRWTAEQFGLGSDPESVARAVDLTRRLPAFDDVVPALERLRSDGVPCAVLSNGTAESLAAILAHAGLAPYFAHVLSVEEVQAYKPHPSVYALACERLGLPPHRLGFVSSNGWDAVGAGEYGLRTVWCNRRRLPLEPFGKLPDRAIASLDEL